MKRARQDEANHEFFDQYAPATIKDFVPPIVMFSTLFLSGAWILLDDHQGWFNIVVLIVVFVALGYETHKTANYWKNSMGSEK
jgi:uncharacterized membrane protein YdbT with pleckstrin-like domain